MNHSQASARPTRIERGSAYPLSYSQAFIWHHRLWAPDAPAHFWHLPLPIRIRGTLDLATFREALSRLVARHEAIRTTFHVLPSGEPVQRIAAPGAPDLVFQDLRSHAPQLRENEVERLLREAFRAPFDLGAAPPFRTMVIQLTDDEHLCFSVAHHLIADGWSQGLFLRELAADYEAACQARASEVSEPKLHYVDYAVWQRQRTEDGSFDAMIDYWVGQLSPPFIGLGLPTPALSSGELEAAHATPYAGAVERFALPQALVERAGALGSHLGGTPFSVFLAAFYLLLHGRTGMSDLLVSVPVANRPRSCLNVVGCFAKQVPYRVRFDDNPSFEELVRRVQEVNRGAQANQAAPIVKAVERLGLHHAPQAAIGKAVFIFQNAMVSRAMVSRIARHDVSFEMEIRWDLLDFAREDMVWQLMATSAGLASMEGWIEYRTGLYTAAFVKSLAKDYVEFLDQAITAPARSLSTFA